MISERELVGRLYRADWTKLALTGTVTGGKPVDTVFGAQPDEPPSGSRQQEEDTPCTLSVAPGRRFRAEGADGSWVTGCDGERMWHWEPGRAAGMSILFGLTGSPDRPRPPYSTLLAPSWLLTEYSLVLAGELTVCGRPGIRVLGTPRPVTQRPAQFGGRFGGKAGGGLFAPPARWLYPDPSDEVDAGVDAELGILLRCSKRSGAGMPAVTEFTSLDVTSTADPALFRAPTGSMFGGGKRSETRRPGERPAGGPTGNPLGDALGEALETARREAAKTVAGMAAGGLGALIKYAPKGRVDPFAQATAEAADPEAAMPTDEQPPDDSPPRAEGRPPALPDEVVHLVYRGGLAAPSLRATLHQWADLDPVLTAVPQSARDSGFGGVGFLVDAVRDVTREEVTGAHHAMSTVAMGGWNEYRIDVVRPLLDAKSLFGRGRRKNAARTIASDGGRLWLVYSDQVIAGPAAAPPSDLADLLDASWLLDRDIELSGGTEVWTGGRRAYRIVARYRDVARLGMGWWQRLFFPAVALVDAETGRVLRLTRFKDGRPTLRQELRDVAPLEPGAGFGFTPPDGVPVVDPESLFGGQR